LQALENARRMKIINVGPMVKKLRLGIKVNICSLSFGSIAENQKKKKGRSVACNNTDKSK